MIKTGHLGTREVFAIVVVASVTSVFLNFPQQLVKMGGQAGWIIPLISTALCLVVWWMIAPVFARSKSDLISLSERYLGKWVQKAILLLIVMMLLLETASTTRLFTETVITTVLPRSPISFVTIPLVALMVYYAYQGIEGMSRVSLLLFPVAGGASVLLLALNFNWVNYDNIQPFLGHGIPDLLTGGGMVMSVFGNLLFLMLLASRLRHPAAVVKIGYWSIVVVGFSYVAVTLMFLLIFPEESAVRAAFPMYQLGRLIYIGRFVQRMEAAFVFIWVSMAVIDMAFMLWLCGYLLATIFRMPVSRPLTFPLTVLTYALAFFPKSFPEMLELTNELFRYVEIVIGLLIPVLIMLWVRFRMRKGGGLRERSP